MDSERSKYQLSRRELFAAAVGFSGTLILSIPERFAAALPSPEDEVTPERLTIHSAFGLHDTPVVGGSLDILRAMSDYKSVNASVITAYDPRAEYLAAAQQNGIRVYVRARQPGNKFHPTSLRETTQRALSYGQDKIITANEPNIPDSTDAGDPISADESAAHFVNAFQLVTSLGAKIGLPPFAQNDDQYSDIKYQQKFLRSIKPHISKSQLEANSFHTIHSYARELYENPANRIETVVGAYEDIYGSSSMPIAITEAGVDPSLLALISEQQYIDHILHTLRSPLPEKQIDAYSFWHYANFGQRIDANRNDPTLQSFERAAWVTETGVTPLFERVREERNPLPIVPQQGDVFIAHRANIS